MELGANRPSPLWFLEPNSIIVVYMDPLGYTVIIELLEGASAQSFWQLLRSLEFRV